MADTHAPGHAAEHAEGQPHASWRFYVVIGAVLGIITGIEVAIFFIPALDPVLIPVLIILSIAKFIIVVQFFMHLKFDHPVFGRVFWAPLFLAVLVVLGMLILFHVLPKYGKFA